MDGAEKQCSRCGISKSLAMFNRSSKSRDGLQYACRDCQRQRRAAYYQANKQRENERDRKYREENRERERARWAEYSQKRWGAERQERARQREERIASATKACTRCGETKAKTEFYADPRNVDGLYFWCKACFNAHGRASYDPKVARIRRLRWLEKEGSKQKVYLKTARWRHKNLERARESVRRYQARKFGSQIGEVDYRVIWARDNGLCHICGTEVAPNDVHYDHIIPLSRGGSHSMENIAVAHSTCNLRKNDKLMEELRDAG